MIVHCPKCNELIRDEADACPCCHAEFSEADKETMRNAAAETQQKYAEEDSKKEPLDIKALIITFIEMLILCASLSVIIISYREAGSCYPAPDTRNFDLTTTIDHELTDPSSDTVFPAGTEFKVPSIYEVVSLKTEEPIGDLTVDIVKDDVRLSVSIDECGNSEELRAAYREKLERYEQEKLEYENAQKDARVGTVVICLIISAIVSLLFLLFNRSDKSLMVKITVLVIIGAVCLVNAFALSRYFAKAHAPIIYLYPEEETSVNVRLFLNGKLTSSYPSYNEDLGWTVTASPDGTLTDGSGREYNYLFWEGDLAIKPDLSHGYCVKGEDTEAFLERSLAELGLNDSEADTFIMYWLPKMEGNRYNVITFQTTAYEDAASLYITPEPDTVIRVNMLWYASPVYIDMEPQDLASINPSAREGFTVVEWGGEKYGKGLLSFIAR